MAGRRIQPLLEGCLQQHRRRRDEHERQHPRRPTTPVEQPVAPQKDIKADLERKQREAMEKLEQKGDVQAPAVAPAPVPVAREATRQTEEKPIVQSHEDRLAELRRKSEATKQNASRIEATPELKPAEPEVIAPEAVAKAQPSGLQSAQQEPGREDAVSVKSAKNVSRESRRKSRQNKTADGPSQDG